MKAKEQRQWPKWAKVLEVWEEAAVPDVEILPFSIKEHHPGLPWFDKKTQHQLHYLRNPQLDTACHLFRSLPEFPDDFGVAYKLNAFCRNFDLWNFRSEVLHPVFVKHGTALYEWWNGNARHVLPPVDHDIRYDDLRLFNTPGGWRPLVDSAAKTWKEISENLALVKIPSFMDPRSAEFKEYLEYEDKRAQQRERDEYKRLKRKFEKATDEGVGGE